jgi:hypothetical protein
VKPIRLSQLKEFIGWPVDMMTLPEAAMFGGGGEVGVLVDDTTTQPKLIRFPPLSR